MSSPSAPRQRRPLPRGAVATALRLAARLRRASVAALATTALVAGTVPAASLAAEATILNASYDVGRELFAAINPAFLEHWSKQGSAALKIDQSFAGTSRQAQDIIQGKRVDTITFNQVTDVNCWPNVASCARTGPASSRTTARRTTAPSPSWSARAIRKASRAGTI